MKPIKRFLPKAISPMSVDGPSAITSPSSTCSPWLTIGLWLIHVPWFERLNLSSLYSSSSLLSSLLIRISSASTNSTVPACLASETTPESFAALYSIPVPTNGASVTRSGTAWRCMFDPIKARLASSFSKNGIIAVATETTCLGDTSIISTTSLGNIAISPALPLAATFALTNLPFSSRGSLAWATIISSSSSASIYLISSVTIPSPFFTTLYGVSIKPYSFMIPYVVREPISPILGPSGVSIGHILP